MKKIFLMIMFIIFIFNCKNEKNQMENQNIIKNKDRILIASYNLLRLGDNKNDYRTLSKILSNFDLIGIEEVMNEKGLKKLKKYLEKETKEKWEYIISEKSVGSENYREYYAFLYKKNTFSIAKPLGFYKEKSENEFMREPYGGYFKAGKFDFIFVICHSIFGDKEKYRLIEASNYINVYKYFYNKFEESDVILAGDFNLPADDMAFKNMKLVYNLDFLLNPKENLTTISDNKLVSSYDNFFINKNYTKEYTGNSGVYNFLKNNNINVKKYISDHLPIFSEYSILEDLD